MIPANRRMGAADQMLRAADREQRAWDLAFRLHSLTHAREPGRIVIDETAAAMAPRWRAATQALEDAWLRLGGRPK
jgi:hypothetical protein